jgi:hypothetical protein
MFNPREKKACNNVSAVMQSITKIGSQGAMKSHKKVLHELPRPVERTMTRPASKLLHANIAVRTQ